jgi:hypothetical protein
MPMTDEGEAEQVQLLNKNAPPAEAARGFSMR